MKSVTIPGLEVAVPKGSAFAIETDRMLPKMHMLAAVVAPRGYGKGVISAELLSRLPIDRLFVVSPSASSNKSLLDRLKKMLDPVDVYSDVNDPMLIDMIIAEIDKERDDYERYLEATKRYEALMKSIQGDNPLFQLSQDDMLRFFNGLDFEPPKHRWGGRRPVLAIWFDDVQSSELMSGRGARKVSNLCIKHRHIGQLKQGGALGVSCLFNMQNYKTAQNGIPKALRSNLTFLMLGKTKSKRELLEIAEEFGSEIGEEQFLELYHRATDEPHSFLTIDLFPKKEHVSQFRKNLNTFLIPAGQ